jgi:hypothetical protein
MTAKKLFLSLAPFIFLGLVVTGCATVHQGPLPPGAQLVGGGLDIEWTSNIEGTAILFEKTTGKVVTTQSLAAGDAFDFDVTEPEEAEVLKTLFGRELAPNLHFLLYFVPR